MTREALKAKFPNSGESFLRLNAEPGGTVLHPGHPRPTPELEPNPRDGAMGEVQVQERTGAKFLIRVESFRRRLLDEDNLCEKYHVDLCRYIGALPGDEAGRTKIEVCQQKVGKKEPEFVRIKIYRLR